MSATASDRLDAQTGGALAPPEGALPERALEAGPGMAGVKLAGRRVEADVERAVVSADENETMEGASTFTLVLYDGDDSLLRSRLFSSAVDLELDDDRWFRLVRIASNPPLLTLEFEDRDVARLRDKKGYRKVSRAKSTRAQFVRTLVREVKADPIAFYAPELDKRQRIGKPPDSAPRRSSSKRGAGRGFGDADLHGKEGKLRPSQLRVAASMLSEADKLDPPRNAMLALIIAGLVEAPDFKNPRTGGAGGAYAGPLQYHARNFGMSNARNPRWVTRHFLTKGATGRGGAIFWAKKGLSPADIIDKIHNPGGRHFYASADLRRKAERILDAWGGGDGSSSSGGGSYVKRYEFRRGEPGKPEDSWTAIQRLAQEVRWRAFMRRRTLWYVSEKWLERRPPRLELSRTTEGVQRIEFDADVGKRAQLASVTILADRATALPGDTVKLSRLGEYGDGLWLVSSRRSSRFSPLVTLELKRAAKPLPEPASERAQRPGESSGGTGGGDGKSTGSWQWPTQPHPVTSPFGQRWGRLHDGIDIGVPTGTAVRAVDGGKVTKAGPNGGYGIYVELDHGDGWVSFYAHCSSVAVRAGARVSQGQVIARSGNTGSSTGPHLHFGAHHRGKPVDPRRRLR